MVATTVTDLVCCNCGGRFAMHPDLYAQRVEDKKTFWCPAGHEQHFTGDNPARKAVKLAEQLRETRRALDEAYAKQTALTEQALAARREAGVAKAQATKAKKRAAAALCPAEGCHRSFVQLHRHIASQHPELLEQADHA